MSARPAKKRKIEAKSFTTRISMETWKKVEKYRKYGNWNTNQLMNHALSSFFEIIESTKRHPEIPLICETLRDLSQKERQRFKKSNS
tara:strand:+ start:242 stop:502 length:261 start_codon:yes stop_codon:yes gene_type:complete